MKININEFGENIEGTVNTHKMTMNENANALQFKIFTSNVYSNPIGSVVREITSNCLDSHNEAGINVPVLIKLSKDNITDTNYISFIDFGIGLSPKRIKNNYFSYFSTTKDNSNSLIGGFGIGSKTPLAYKRYNGEGDNEYDNSFFVNTIHNGIKYQYVIMEGEKSPEYALLHSEKTTQENGTEVRIPVLESDIRKFSKEIKQQLFYFENLTFEGFDEAGFPIKTDYKIYKGEHFKYRPDFTVDSNIHVCLGGVYYPINYNVLDLDSWEYQTPIALDIPIGDINVTVSRESLDYSKATICYLKNKLKLVKEELTKMKLKQNEKIITYIDYVKNIVNENKLLIGDHAINLPRFTKIGADLYPNFKFKNLNKIPNESDVIEYLFDDNIYGEKYVYSRFKFRHKIDDIIKKSNKILVASLPKGEQKLIRIKQSYLKDELNSYAILYPNELNENSIEEFINKFNYNNYILQQNNTTDEGKNDLKGIFDEVNKFILDNVQHYDSVIVPEDFRLEYNVRTKSVKNENFEFNAYLINSFGRDVLSTKKIAKFHGKIVYSVKDDPKLDRALEMYRNYFDSTKLVKSIDYYGKNFNKPYGIAFIGVAKTNIKKIKNLPNVITVDEFFKEIGLRKLNEFVKLNHKVKYLKNNASKINKIRLHDSFFMSNSNILNKMGVNYSSKIFVDNQMLRGENEVNNLNQIYPNIDFDGFDECDETIEFKKEIDGLINFIENNELMIKLINSDNIMNYIDENEVNDLMKLFKL